MSPLFAPTESERTATHGRSAADPQSAPSSVDATPSARATESPQNRHNAQSPEAPETRETRRSRERPEARQTPPSSQTPKTIQAGESPQTQSSSQGPKTTQPGESPQAAPSSQSLKAPQTLKTADSPDSSRTPRSSRKTHAATAAQTHDSLVSLVGPEHLFALSSDALVVVDAQTLRIRAWNRRAETLFGYTAASTVDHPIDLIMPPDLARLHRERLAHFARTGDPTVLHSRSDLVSEFIGHDARPRAVYVSVADVPTVTHDGPHLVLFTIRSAERADGSSALDAAAGAIAQSEATSESAEDAAVGATAEGQAPSDSTEDAPATDTPELDAATMRQQLRRAHHTATQLGRRMTDGTLSPDRLARQGRVKEARVAAIDRSFAAREDMRKVTEGPQRFLEQRERVNLVPLFASLVAEFRAATAPSSSTNDNTNKHNNNKNTHDARTATAAGGPGFRLNLATPQGLTIQGDPDHIAYVMRFLLADARRRNPRGCWIDVDLRRPLGGLAHIGVRDYGRALPQGEQSRLPNQPTTDDGWLLVQGIVMRMGGTLSYDLPEEGGLRVGIDLPVNGIRPRPRPRARSGG